MVLEFFERGFGFSETLFLSEDMRICSTEGYFENL